MAREEIMQQKLYRLNDGKLQKTNVNFLQRTTVQ